MEVQLPDAMVENQLDGLIQELRGHLQSQNVELEQYLEASGASMEELRAHAREQAVSAARFELAMTEIARLEGIDVTDAEVEQKYNELSAQYQLSADLLRQQLPPMRLRHDLKLARAQASSWTPPAANKLTYTEKGSRRLHSLRLPFSYGFYDARFTAPKYQPPSPSDTALSTLSRIT